MTFNNYMEPRESNIYIYIASLVLVEYIVGAQKQQAVKLNILRAMAFALIIYISENTRSV